MELCLYLQREKYWLAHRQKAREAKQIFYRGNKSNVLHLLPSRGEVEPKPPYKNLEPIKISQHSLIAAQIDLCQVLKGPEDLYPNFQLEYEYQNETYFWKEQHYLKVPSRDAGPVLCTKKEGNCCRKLIQMKVSLRRLVAFWWENNYYYAEWASVLSEKRLLQPYLDSPWSHKNLQLWTLEGILWLQILLGYSLIPQVAFWMTNSQYKACRVPSNEMAMGSFW